MSDSKEVLFARTLEKCKKIAREQGNSISEEQITTQFSELELTKEQLEMISDYLSKYKINVGNDHTAEDSMSEEDIDYLSEYKKELALLEQYNDGQTEAITLSAMAGETEAQSKLITIYLPRVLEISKLYTGQGVFLEDLIGEGNVALTMGVTMLGCLEHASEAEGMLMKLVMDAMEESITESVQEADKDTKIVNSVNKVASKARELAEDLHRKVTIAELASETGLSEKSIKDAMRISGFAIEDIEN